MSTQKKLSTQDVIRLERDLAKFANMMDSVVRIPFTKQGVGADAALSTIPVAGDVAGFVLTCYAIYKAKQLGVPQAKLNGVMKLAMIDAVVGFVPVLGTLFHVIHPFLHERLEQKQQHSAFWRNPVVAWLWIHIPDILGVIVLFMIGLALWFGLTWLWEMYQNWQGHS